MALWVFCMVVPLPAPHDRSVELKQDFQLGQPVPRSHSTREG